MSTPVVTVAAGGIAVVDVTSLAPMRGMPVTEATNGLGIAVTKVVGKPGLPVVFDTGGAAGTINSPLDLTGLLGWWDASVTASLSLTTNQVNSIADQSGAGRTMNWAGFGKPTYSATGFNSKPVVQITTAVGSALESAAGFPMGTGNTLTIFMVCTRAGATSNSDNPRYLSYKALGATGDWENIGSWAFTAAPSGIMSNVALSRDADAITPIVAPAAVGNRVLICTVNSSGVVTVYVDGVATTCQTAAGNWVSGGSFGVGRKAIDGAPYITADFAEWGVATGFHNATQVGQLNTYLKTKWGL